ncbi:hypothetical protein FisN_24Hu068 [Fistulifera solaris]|jgi:hypothetical protein|uniref:BTB domain-containing protein n=1 Tax=Fistulifera solaris TaxID=1519565 RepID=A0A1Z5JER4_FISSO|nr:hypothetical protein FisN_24Hu068 [Fistulifera solaris]|eukprot:GAX12493.1 hypothetical protein FisN_24Hu068 [Fistulifera solaris]
MDQDDQPKWRDDPSDSFSDWKIEIISQDENEKGEKSHLYHVHKMFLAHGSRRSEYFFKLFRSETDFKENQSNMSQITLDPLAAKAFPCLLDYIYGANLCITTETATALHHLAEYFEIKPLQRKALEFLEADISVENVHISYVHAKQLCNEPVMSLVTDFLKRNISAVLPTTPIVEQSSPDLWLSVLDLNGDQDKIEIKNTVQLSQVIARMCIRQPKETLDATTFHTLADGLTRIHSSVAWELSELADAYRLHDEKVENESGLPLIQERCIDSLATKWQTLDGADKAQLEKMRQRSPAFLVELLVQTVREASKEIDAMAVKLAEWKRKLKEHNKVNRRYAVRYRSDSSSD